MRKNLPLLVTRDPVCIEEVTGLAAAHGIEVHLASDARSARAHWQAASLVMVGDDAAEDLVEEPLGRRSRVLLLATHESDAHWRKAMALGAEHVVVLPDGSRWLLDELGSATEGPSRNGAVLAVLPATGGAGASTFAATVARCTAARMRTIVIDADPLGGGIDVLLGMEGAPGIRWPDIADTRGRLAASALADALPSVEGMSVLSWSRSGPAEVMPGSFAEVLDAAVRGFDAVVVDLPRVLDGIVDAALARASSVVVVSTTRVRSVISASRLIPEVRQRAADVSLVVRADGRGLGPDAIEHAVGEREALRLPFSQRIPLAADAGDLVPLRDPYGRCCAGFVGAWARELERAA